MTASLQHLLAPRSIAIVGASEDFSRINGRPLKFLIEKKYEGAIYPVNPKYPAIAGRRCYPNAAAIPDPVDLAIVVVPAALVLESLADLGAKGIDTAIVFSSGFAEMGEEGARLQAELAEAAHALGIRICGPNCLGLINAFDNVMATFSQFADGATPSGPVGFVTQAGAFGTAIAALARRRDLGLGYFVNTGNEADIGFCEVMHEVISDPRIHVGAGYIEGLKDGEGLIEVARQALKLGKPLVLTKVGRTESGARAAISHTGSAAGDDKVFSGVARQFGIVRARNEEHMLDMVETFSHCELPQGAGIGIVTQSGGAGVLMADRAEELGLKLPVLSAQTTEKLRAAIPGFGVAHNPVDITGQFVAEPDLLERSVHLLLADAAIHVGIVWLQLMDARVDRLLAIFSRIKTEAAKPFVVCWVAAPAAAIQGLHAMGIPALRGAEAAIDAVAGLIEHAAARRSWAAREQEEAAQVLSLPVLSPARGQLSATEAAALLAAVGVPLVPITIVHSGEEAARVARAFERPAVLKVESPDISRRTEDDGVIAGLTTDSEVRAAYDEIMRSAQHRHPGARIAGVAVQPMAPAGLELVIGLQRDSIFGVVVMVGLGGVMFQVLRDVVFRAAPVSSGDAGGMLDALQGRALLDGVEGRAGVSKAEIALLIANVSRLGAALGPRLRELELSPVIASGATLFAADWRVVLD